MDLTTPEYVLAIVEGLSPAEVAALPQQISSASALIQSWCNRPLGLITGLDEVYTPERGEEVILRNYPVVGITAVEVGPRTILRINRTGPATAATVEVPSDTPTTRTGSTLILRAKSLGAWANSTIEFTSLATPTVAALAAAVNALGGWTATVQGDYGGFGVDDLLAGGGPEPGLGDGAELRAFTEAARYRVDRAAGLLALIGGDYADPFASPRFGPTGSIFEDDLELPGTPVRVRYDAGYNPVPLEVQTATAELVKATFERFGTSSVLQSEKTASWSWTAREFGEVIGGMPDSVRQVIALYKDHAR